MAWWHSPLYTDLENPGIDAEVEMPDSWLGIELDGLIDGDDENGDGDGTNGNGKPTPRPIGQSWVWSMTNRLWSRRESQPESEEPEIAP